jgi:DNA invertase Pin-like site-specific DNA recombinase
MAARRLASVPEAPRTAVAYVRVSTVRGREGERFHSPDVQLEAIRALAAQRGLVEVAVVQDIDRTGRDFSREGVQRIMEMARARQVDVVAVYDLSRFGRNTAESLRYIADLRELGVSVVSTTEQIDDSPEGQFMLGQFLGMAQLYSDQIGRRWAQIHERRHEQGKFHAKVPLGYLIENGRAVVDPVLGPIVTWAFETYLAGTTTQKEIARRLGQARGRPVRQGVVSNLLRNPFHAGQVKYRRELRPGEHTPLVSAEVFEALQRKLARDLELAPHVRGPQSAITGLVCCDACGRLLWRRGRGAEVHGGRPRLRCGTPACVGVGAPFVDEVERAVLERVLVEAERLRDGTPAERERRAKLTRLRDDADRLLAEHKTLLRRLDTAAEKLVAGVLSDAAYRRVTGPLQSRADEITVLLGQVQDSPLQRPAAELASAAARMRRLWDGGMTSLEQRAALLLFVDRVWLRRASYRGQPVADRLRFPD